MGFDLILPPGVGSGTGSWAADYPTASPRVSSLAESRRLQGAAELYFRAGLGPDQVVPAVAVLG